MKLNELKAGAIVTLKGNKDYLSNCLLTDNKEFIGLWSGVKQFDLDEFNQDMVKYGVIGDQERVKIIAYYSGIEDFCNHLPTWTRPKDVERFEPGERVIAANKEGDIWSKYYYVEYSEKYKNHIVAGIKDDWTKQFFGTKHIKLCKKAPDNI